jgi:hypothetical protein
MTWQEILQKQMRTKTEGLRKKQRPGGIPIIEILLSDGAGSNASTSRNPIVTADVQRPSISPPAATSRKPHGPVRNHPRFGIFTGNDGNHAVRTQSRNEPVAVRTRNVHHLAQSWQFPQTIVKRAFLPYMPILGNHPEIVISAANETDWRNAFKGIKIRRLQHSL